jgi:hypothetical protein
MIGADYSTGRPGGAALAAAAVQAVGRYASVGRDTPGDNINITAAEVRDLRNHGIDVFIYNEHSAGYMLGGAAAAARYAPGAAQVCKAAGLPNGPIFYAVDFDATLGGTPVSAKALANMAKLADFLKGAAKATSWDLVGVYGGYYTIRWLLDELPQLGHAVQTSAWSTGQAGIVWEPRAFCRQDGYNWMINKVNCDHLTIMRNDGSLRYGTNPKPPTSADVKALQRAVGATVDGVWGMDTDSRSEVIRHHDTSYHAHTGVYAVQAVLGVTIDGMWGPDTTAAFDKAVKGMQAALKVTADGVWGPKTEAAYLAASPLH